MPLSRRRTLTIVGIVVGVILVGVVLGPFIYIHFFAGSTPAKLSLDTNNDSGQTTTTLGAPTKPLDGTWKVGHGSTAGYRVDEVLFGQTTTAVGRTDHVTGQIQIQGTDVTAANVTVDLTTVTSNKSQRDSQFQGPIMNTSQFPTTTFRTTAPIHLRTAPANGQVIHVPATGTLTLHGQTRPVTVQLEARRTGNTIEVNGEIPVKFADYGIPNPSQSFVTTKDHGTIEFLVSLQPT
jgi:polyisoprenoid-binding protein YceI